MRRAVVVLGSTAAGLAALFSYKTHVPGTPLASSAPVAPAMSASGTSSGGGSPSASASPSRSTAGKATAKATAKAVPAKSPSAKPTPTVGTTSGGGTSGGGTSGGGTSTTAAPTKTATAPAKPSGNFTGSDVNTQYGPVQVQITVSNGKITAASDVQQPGDSIAQNAVRRLNQEVLTAQSANIQAVSGATYTSQGYLSSLQGAVSKAGL